MATYKLVDSDKLDAAMTATADAIREKTGSTDSIAWDAEKGMSEAVEPVFAAGKKSEYDAFWDIYQNCGQRNEYSCAFSGKGWNDTTFCPKYDIIPIYSYDMFKLSLITDLEFLLNRCGVVLDLSKSARASGLFASCESITVCPEIDISATTYLPLTQLFSYCKKLHTIRKLKIREDGGNTFSIAFEQCTSLENIILEGTIGSAFDIHWSTKLSKDSIISIINALSTVTTSLTVTLSLTAVNTAFETTAGAADGSTSEEWAALIATKTNWTIALADV